MYIHKLLAYQIGYKMAAHNNDNAFFFVLVNSTNISYFGLCFNLILQIVNINVNITTL